jgi:SpoU rRNA methylase family enzyme
VDAKECGWANDDLANVEIKRGPRVHVVEDVEEAIEILEDSGRVTMARW